MNAASLSRSDRTVTSIARRALDLAHDPQSTTEESIDHLRRLARGRHDVLLGALRDLAHEDGGPDVVCARHLVVQAMTFLPHDFPTTFPTPTATPPE